MDGEAVVAVWHVAAATSALAVGAVVLLLRKGTPLHRTLGRVYAVALVCVNVAALSLHRESAFGVFHVLAVVSLVTMAVGLGPLVTGRRTPGALARHGYCMAWSYAGLVAAGSGQLVVAAGPDLGAWSVPTAILAVLVVGGALISWRVPSALDRVLASGRSGSERRQPTWR